MRAILPLVLLVSLSACASLTDSDHHALRSAVISQHVELQVPFFPQEIHQCGPAALASVLKWAGVQVTPEALADEVYIPDRKGSLQTELVAAARRHDRVPYILAPELAALLSEIEAGHPVVVLQNLAFNWYPRWHFSVVIGYDLDREVVILHSGREERDVMGLDVFLRTWSRSGRWAMLALRSDELPARAQEDLYVRSVVALETQGRLGTARDAYMLALRRWPTNLTAQMGLGNIAYTDGHLEEAVIRFRRAVHDHPESAAAHNNLAYVLTDQGFLDEAEEEARRAVALGGANDKDAADTLARILRRR